MRIMKLEFLDCTQLQTNYEFSLKITTIIRESPAVLLTFR